MIARAISIAIALLAWASVAHAQDGNARAERLAKKSAEAERAMRYLDERAQAIKDPALKAAANELLKNPAPTFLRRFVTAADREQARAALVAAGFLDGKVSLAQLFPPLAAGGRAPQSFLAAPAQALGFHHAHPGGLAEHTAFNVELALALAATYADRYALRALDLDTVAAAALLHDAMKPWVLQWRADGTLTEQPKIAGTASHHPFIVAEAFYRKLPAAFLVALASAHDAPSGDTAIKVVGYLRAGALLAGVDPVAYGVLARRGDGGFALARAFSVESVINHLSDHDYVLTDPAGVAVTDGLAQLLRKRGPVDEARLRWAIARIESQVPGPRLYAAFARGGLDELGAEVERAHVPWSSDED